MTVSGILKGSIDNGHERQPVAVVHDYLTQRGGAERVVLAMLAAFPRSTIYTSLYEPDLTFPEFEHFNVQTLPIDRVGLLRRNHHLAMPLLAPSFSYLVVDAAVALCSSSGWAHGAQVTGRKVVYCHNPARWLYQSEQYLGDDAGVVRRVANRALGPWLRRWDRRAAHTANRYIVNSSAVRNRVKATYGIDAEVLHPPVVSRANDVRMPADIEPGYWLCVSRLLPYKNLTAVLSAFECLPEKRLVLVGQGPQERQLRASCPKNVTITGEVDDAQLNWFYANCCGLVSASYEDFGLCPLEANAFGKPVAALAWGGHLDTVEGGINGLFFDEPEPVAIAQTIRQVDAEAWSPKELVRHSRNFEQLAFVDRLQEIVAVEASLG